MDARADASDTDAPAGEEPSGDVEAQTAPEVLRSGALGGDAEPATPMSLPAPPDSLPPPCAEAPIGDAPSSPATPLAEVASGVVPAAAQEAPSDGAAPAGGDEAAVIGASSVDGALRAEAMALAGLRRARRRAREIGGRREGDPQGRTESRPTLQRALTWRGPSARPASPAASARRRASTPQGFGAPQPADAEAPAAPQTSGLEEARGLDESPPAACEPAPDLSVHSAGRAACAVVVGAQRSQRIAESCGMDGARSPLSQDASPPQGAHLVRWVSALRGEAESLRQSLAAAEAENLELRRLAAAAGTVAAAPSTSARGSELGSSIPSESGWSSSIVPSGVSSACDAAYSAEIASQDVEEVGSVLRQRRLRDSLPGACRRPRRRPAEAQDLRRAREEAKTLRHERSMLRTALEEAAGDVARLEALLEDERAARAADRRRWEAEANTFEGSLQIARCRSEGLLASFLSPSAEARPRRPLTGMLKVAQEAQGRCEELQAFNAELVSLIAELHLGAARQTSALEREIGTAKKQQQVSVAKLAGLDELIKEEQLSAHRLRGELYEVRKLHLEREGVLSACRKDLCRVEDLYCELSGMHATATDTVTRQGEEARRREEADARRKAGRRERCFRLAACRALRELGIAFGGVAAERAGKEGMEPCRLQLATVRAAAAREAARSRALFLRGLGVERPPGSPRRARSLFPRAKSNQDLETSEAAESVPPALPPAAPAQPPAASPTAAAAPASPASAPVSAKRAVRFGASPAKLASVLRVASPGKASGAWRGPRFPGLWRSAAAKEDAAAPCGEAGEVAETPQAGGAAPEGMDDTASVKSGASKTSKTSKSSPGESVGTDVSHCPALLGAGRLVVKTQLQWTLVQPAAKKKTALARMSSSLSVAANEAGGGAGAEVASCDLDAIVFVGYGYAARAWAISPEAPAERCVSVYTASSCHDFVCATDGETEAVVVSLGRLCGRTRAGALPGAIQSRGRFLSAMGWCKVQSACRADGETLPARLLRALRGAAPAPGGPPELAPPDVVVIPPTEPTELAETAETAEPAETAETAETSEQEVGALPSDTPAKGRRRSAPARPRRASVRGGVRRDSAESQDAPRPTAEAPPPSPSAMSILTWVVEPGLPLGVEALPGIDTTGVRELVQMRMRCEADPRCVGFAVHRETGEVMALALGAGERTGAESDAAWQAQLMRERLFIDGGASADARGVLRRGNSGSAGASSGSSRNVYFSSKRPSSQEAPQTVPDDSEFLGTEMGRCLGRLVVYADGGRSQELGHVKPSGRAAMWPLKFDKEGFFHWRDGSAPLGWVERHRPQEPIRARSNAVVAVLGPGPQLRWDFYRLPEAYTAGL